MTWELRLERRQVKPITTMNGLIANGNARANAGKRRVIREWRAWARQEATRLGWGPVDPALFPLVVEVVHLHASNVRADPGAAYVLAKAMVDGLHDLGEGGEVEVIPDDDDRFVYGYWLGPALAVTPDGTGHRHGVRVILHESTWTPPPPDTLSLAPAAAVPSTRVHTPTSGVTLTGSALIIDAPSPSTRQ